MLIEKYLISSVVNWANQNLSKFRPNGFARQYGDIRLLGYSDEIIEIKKQIINNFNLANCYFEPIYGDFCGYIKDGGAVHRHKDNNVNNLIHTRFNVLISKPIEGGIAVIDNKEIFVEEGEVWKCEAGLYEHWTTPVIGIKPRIILSFGFLL